MYSSISGDGESDLKRLEEDTVATFSHGKQNLRPYHSWNAQGC